MGIAMGRRGIDIVEQHLLATACDPSRGDERQKWTFGYALQTIALLSLQA
ncbi:hypothetical protein [Micromonospora haikouensis]